MKTQKLFQGDAADFTAGILKETGAKNILLACGRHSFDKLGLAEKFAKLPANFIRFSDFSENPTYEMVLKGLAVFRENKAELILAIGGGSAIDVAKCIKIFAPLKPGADYLAEEFQTSNTPLAAIPTTAGTGSEATHFAVIYKDGQKHSVSHECLRPDFACLDEKLLATLPAYTKKSALLDALSQAIESWWSVRVNETSQNFSKAAIEGIAKNAANYLAGDKAAAREILFAAHKAGEAINITTTTAAHAMSYKLTSLYHIAHGHAVAVCLPFVWAQMLKADENKCIRPGGLNSLKNTFAEIAAALGTNSPEAAIKNWRDKLKKLGLNYPKINESEIAALVGSVNPQRLGNNPIAFGAADLEEIYRDIGKSK